MSTKKTITFTERIKPFLQLTPIQLVALTVWAEARGEPNMGWLAVIWVIRNRLRLLKYYGSKIPVLSKPGMEFHSVILKPLQFSCYNANDPQFKTLVAIAEDFERELDKKNKLADIYSLVCSAHNIPDPTFGATHYHNFAVSPAWNKSPNMIQTNKIGNHIFYREVR